LIGGLEELGVDPVPEERGGAIGLDQAPETVDDQRRDDVDRVADVVKFRWEMVSADGAIAGVGLAFLVLATDGRIRLDYQFIES
jgi:hypothetical protein